MAINDVQFNPFSTTSSTRPGQTVGGYQGNREQQQSINIATIGTKNPAALQGTGYVPTGDGQVHPIADEGEHILNFYA